jgi:hypothetical protein
MNTNNRPAAIVLINLAFALLLAYAAYSVLMEIISSVENGDFVTAAVCVLPAALMVFLSVVSLDAATGDQ